MMIKKLLKFKPAENKELGQWADDYRAYAYDDLVCAVIELIERSEWEWTFEVKIVQSFSVPERNTTSRYKVVINKRGNIMIDNLPLNTDPYIYAIATVQLEILSGAFLACSYLCPEDFDTAPDEYFKLELLDKYSMDDLDFYNNIIIKGVTDE